MVVIRHVHACPVSVRPGTRLHTHVGRRERERERDIEREREGEGEGEGARDGEGNLTSSRGRGGRHSARRNALQAYQLGGREITGLFHASSTFRMQLECSFTHARKQKNKT